MLLSLLLYVIDTVTKEN